MSILREVCQFDRCILNTQNMLHCIVNDVEFDSSTIKETSMTFSVKKQQIYDTNILDDIS